MFFYICNKRRSTDLCHFWMEVKYRELGVGGWTTTTTRRILAEGILNYACVSKSLSEKYKLNKDVETLLFSQGSAV